MEDYALAIVNLALVGLLVLATVGWADRGRQATIVLAALTVAGLVTLGVLASAVLWPVDADRTAMTAVLGLTGLLAVIGGGPVTTAVFKLVDGSHAAEASSVRSAGEVLRGGAWIGALERAAVYATLVAGWPEGVAIVLGLKGLGRYPELKAEGEGTAERFIIGTFASVLWAAACAAVVVLVR